MRISSYFFELFERFFSSNSIDKVPIFIVGAPRSGSTLLYQSMVSYFDIGYFNNFHHKNYLCPSFAEYRKRSLKKNNSINYRSNYGEISGEFSPSECWDFWYRFFRKHPHYSEIEDIDDRNQNLMNNAVRSFINITKKNLLIKNLPCATRIQPLLKVFPKAYWIIINRNPLDNALSIAKMRLDSSHDLNKWDSVEPKGFEKYIDSPYQIQIFKQIELIQQTLIIDLEDIKGRVSIVNYEELCSSPIEVFKNLEKKMNIAGIVIPRNRKKPPQRFLQKSNSTFESDYSKEILNYYRLNRKHFDTLNEKLNRIFTE